MGTQIVTLEWLRACERTRKIVTLKDRVPPGKVFWHKKKRPRESNTNRGGKKQDARKKRKVKPAGAKGVQISFSDVVRGITNNRRKRSQSSQLSQASQSGLSQVAGSQARVPQRHGGWGGGSSNGSGPDDVDFKELQKELLEGGGTGKDLDVGDLMARVKRNRGACTPNGDSDDGSDGGTGAGSGLLELPANYYTSIPQQQKQNVGTPPLRDGGDGDGGGGSGDGLGGGGGGRGDDGLVDDKDESQGVRWGSDEED